MKDGYFVSLLATHFGRPEAIKYSPTFTGGLVGQDDPVHHG